MATQKVALITAGTAGLGAQIARVLAPDFRIVINYANNQARATSLLDELHGIPRIRSAAQSPRFDAIQADVGDRSAIQRLVQETVAKFGRLDVVVSNAGWTRVTNFNVLDEGMIDEDWDKCFLYNVKSHLWLMHAAKEELERREGAFPSICHVICSPKIRVNSVSPGLLLTDWGMSFGPAKIEAATNATKLKRLATVEDVADQVRVLATTKSMTGQNLVVDSGLTL
ncbi:hypothetical protein B0A50_02649 [Salinomyces thailandicus]|uniref:Uncharacterized protein n=1 Tax=Salinomyces thailandicus TaxID=706561 RepID=A0A4U0U728_9PEZI|nr:hypothetical protein B0A50_02649 [Salinomyces thailandica]